MQSPHDAASAYQDAAVCYKKTNTAQAVLLFKEVVSIHIDMGRFTTAAKIEKEIGELHEAEGDSQSAIEAFQTAADYYENEGSNSTSNQMLLKVADLAARTGDLKRAIEIYERVAIVSLESNLLKFSVKDYLLRAGICRLATGEIGPTLNAIERYEGMDASFGTTREGVFLKALAEAFEAMEEVREPRQRHRPPHAAATPPPPPPPPVAVVHHSAPPPTPLSLAHRRRCCGPARQPGQPVCALCRRQRAPLTSHRPPQSRAGHLHRRRA